MNKGDKKISLGKKEFEKHFQEQLDFLLKSAQDFDRGDYKEAKRIASTIRTLLHNTKKSTSLLRLLGVENDIEFMDYSFEYDPGLMKSFHPLVSVGMLNSRYYPVLDGNGVKKVSFNDYWNKIVFKDKNGNDFSRKDVVLFLANEDGGSHVDPGLSEAYYELSRNNSLGWTGKNGEVETIVEGAESAAVRQVAHEILKTFNKDGYDYSNAAPDLMITGVSAFTQPVVITKTGVYPKVGRNEPCPCGAKKEDGRPLKFKRCHGK